MFHGRLYESSGLYGHSKIIARPVPEKGPVAPRGVALDKSLFAEGLSFYRGRLYLLTWRAGLLLEIDPERFTLLRRHQYRGQGWGLCYHQGRNLFAMTDGSHQLQWRRPDDFSLVDQRAVDGPSNYSHLNELECHDDYILANQWKTSRIIVIHANSGRAIAELDLSALAPTGLHEEAVLNGIAYDARDNTWLVTGKLWPKIYRIRFTIPSTDTTKTPAQTE